MGRHPHFVSGLGWHTVLDDALAEATRDGKRLLVVVGRATCAGTRALVERTLAKEELEEYTLAHFVLLAAEADQPEPRVAEIVGALAVRSPTPLCIYLATDGRVLTSTAGGRPPAVLLNDMLGAASKK
jgi:hypothetical protein